MAKTSKAKKNNDLSAEEKNYRDSLPTDRQVDSAAPLGDSEFPDAAPFGGTWDEKETPAKTPANSVLAKTETLAETASQFALTHTANAELGARISSEVTDRVQRKKAETVLAEVEMLTNHLGMLHVSLANTRKEIERYEQILERIAKGDFEISGTGRIYVKGLWPPQ